MGEEPERWFFFFFTTFTLRDIDLDRIRNLRQLTDTAWGNLFEVGVFWTSIDWNPKSILCTVKYHQHWETLKSF